MQPSQKQTSRFSALSLRSILPNPSQLNISDSKFSKEDTELYGTILNSIRHEDIPNFKVVFNAFIRDLDIRFSFIADANTRQTIIDTAKFRFKNQLTDNFNLSENSSESLIKLIEAGTNHTGIGAILPGKKTNFQKDTLAALENKRQNRNSEIEVTAIRYATTSVCKPEPERKPNSSTFTQPKPALTYLPYSSSSSSSSNLAIKDYSQASSIKGTIINNIPTEQRSRLSNWITIVLKSIVDITGGEVTVSTNQDHQLQISVTGKLNVKYSIYAAFRKLQANNLEQIQELTEDNMVLTLSTAKLNEKMKEYTTAEYTAAWLHNNGYTISLGQKPCASVFTEDDSFKNKDDNELKQRLGISYEIAEQLSKTAGNIVLPFSLNIETTLQGCEQLETYYREAKLTSADGQEKQFNVALKNQGSYQSNLSNKQAISLLEYFERLDLFSRYNGIPCAKLTSETELKAQACQLRAKQFDQLMQNAHNKISPDTVLFLDNIPNTTSSHSQLYNIYREGSYYSEENFEKKVESFVNANFILGPNAFELMANKHPLALAFQNFQTENNLQSQDLSLPPPSVLIPYNNSSYYINQERTLEVIKLYQALNAYYAREIQPPQGMVGKVLLDETRKFHKEYSPYYFIKQATLAVSAILDQPNVTNEQVEQILTMLGVAPENLDNYRIKDTERYNHYQIKFNLIPMVISYFINNQVLMSPSLMSTEQNKWVYNSEYNFYANNVDNAITAQEFSFNKIFGWGCTTSTHPVDRTSSSYYSEDRTDRTTYTAATTTYTSNYQPSQDDDE